MEKILNIENLVVDYGHVHAIRDISMHVDENEIVCLIGSNGAGKTSTLHAISNITEKQSGIITFKGTDVTTMPAAEIVKVGISHVPEGRHVFPKMTVLENLILGTMALKKISKADLKFKLEEMYTLFPRLKERTHQAAGTLSGGEQQMLAIARGLMNNPTMIMLDEPSLGLAPIIVEEIFELILKIQQNGQTVLLIEQNANMALQISNRAYLLENGRSALDAAELTNVGVNYLREHVNRDCYMHYSYINAGDRPNIVPEDAKLWYVVRAYTHKDAKDLQRRVENVAKGACMMTDTSVEFEVLGDNHDNKLNFTLASLACESMEDVGTPNFTEEDKAYAKEVAKNIGIEGVVGHLDESIMQTDGTIKKDNGSSDIADVSQVVPTVNINTTCYGRYTPNHSWAVTAQSRKPAAHKGMLFASQVLALMGVKIANDEELYKKIKQEFDSAE